MSGLAGFRRVIYSDTPDRRDASFTNLGFRGGLEAYPSLQRYRMMSHFRKKKRKKTEKRKKIKRIAFIAWRRRSVKVLPEKIMPEGLRFRWANGAAA